MATALTLLVFPKKNAAQSINLGTCTNFVLFSANGAVTNTGISVITGNVGANIGAVSGFVPPTVLNGTQYNVDAVTAQGTVDLLAAYTQLSALAATNNTHTPAFGSGEILPPGVYTVATSGSLAGTLTLDAGGNPTAVFIFRFGGAFTPGAGSVVMLANGALAANVFWVAEGAIPIGALSIMKGSFIANNGAVSMEAGGNLDGRLLSTTGAVSFSTGIAAIPIVPFVTMQLKVLLQGALVGNGAGLETIMRDNLRSSIFGLPGTRYIPITDPYTHNTDYAPLFIKVGDGVNPLYQTVIAPVIMFADRIVTHTSAVDWIFIELRDKNNPATVLGTRSAIVEQNGTVVDIDGSTCIRFPALATDSYYVAVRHRNHLGAMTAGPIPAASLNCTATVDFTTMTNEQVWHNPATPQFEGIEMATVTNSVSLITLKALWAGDANGDKKIKYTAPGDDLFRIFNNALNYAGNTSSDYNYDFGLGYIAGDVDMNGKVKYTAPGDDAFRVFVQLLGFPLNTGSDYNYDFFVEQLP